MKKTAYYLSPFVIVPIIFLIATLLENEFIDFEENEKDIVSNYFIDSLELLMIEKLDKKRVSL